MTSRFKSCLLAGLIPLILVGGGQATLAVAQVAPSVVEAASAGLTPAQQAIADRAGALGCWAASFPAPSSPWPFPRRGTAMGWSMPTAIPRRGLRCRSPTTPSRSPAC